jgi:hypothetical protein
MAPDTVDNDALDRGDHVTVATLASPQTSGRIRWLNWTCLSCDHPFRSRTRRGLYVTCPNCHEVQPGPEGVRQLRAELARLKTRSPMARPACRDSTGLADSERSEPEAVASTLLPMREAPRRTRPTPVIEPMLEPTPPSEGRSAAPTSDPTPAQRRDGHGFWRAFWGADDGDQG